MKTPSPVAFAEILCWSLGLSLLMLFAIARLGGEHQRQQGIELFKQARAESLAAVRPPSIADATASTLLRTDRPETDDDVTLPIALLRIPGIALELPVFGDTSERNLNRGAGWVEGTAGPYDDDNMAIAAHRDGHFRALKDVAIGDLIELESLSGLRSYRITELSIVEPTNLTPLSSSDQAELTLITCYPFYFIGNAPQRYIVRAVSEKPD